MIQEDLQNTTRAGNWDNIYNFSVLDFLSTPNITHKRRFRSRFIACFISPSGRLNTLARGPDRNTEAARQIVRRLLLDSYIPGHMCLEWISQGRLKQLVFAVG